MFNFGTSVIKQKYVAAFEENAEMKPNASAEVTRRLALDTIQPLYSRTCQTKIDGDSLKVDRGSQINSVELSKYSRDLAEEEPTFDVHGANLTKLTIDILSQPVTTGLHPFVQRIDMKV